MFAANGDLSQHTFKNIGLLLLSLVFIPINTIVLAVALFLSYITKSAVARNRGALQNDSRFRPKTVLVTGVGMSKGLVLARLFYEAGHYVIGADLAPNGVYACGRVSKSLNKFHVLPDPNTGRGSTRYIEGSLDLVQAEKVDLWVSCSGVVSAVEDGMAKEIIEARTACKAVQFDVATTQMLHEKHSFISHTKDIGLTIPETHTVTSVSAVKIALSRAPDARKFIMKPIGVDDANRGDMTLLPKRTSEETAEHLSRLKISDKSPWILQQYINGPEYCTHSLVINGMVKAFVACPSAELLMHYEPLPSNSPISQAMLKFTQAYAKDGGKGFTGHLSFDFMAERTESGSAATGIAQHSEPVLYPIECNPRAHTAVILFNGTPSLIDAYVSVLDQHKKSGVNGVVDDTLQDIVIPYWKDRYFWVGHDIIELLLLPLLSLLTLQPGASVTEVVRRAGLLINHIVFWRDGTFELWDPAPWWWLYHVYWLMQFLNSLRSGQRWSRVNVSTTKVFKC